MKHTREQKRAKLLAAAQAVIEGFLDWEEQAAQPNLTGSKMKCSGPASSLGNGWPKWRWRIKKRNNPWRCLRVRVVGSRCVTRGRKAWKSKAEWAY